MTVTDAELAFYQSVVADPSKRTLTDLRYAFYIGVLTGQIVLGGGGGSAVSSVNSQTGAVTLDSDDVGALAAALRGAADGVASLDASGLIPATELPAPTISQRGAARFATQAEALAGTLDNIVITPKTLKDVLTGANPEVHTLLVGSDTSAIPDGSIIGFYDPSGPLVAGVTAQGTVISTGTGNVTITTLADMPVGSTLFVAVSRGITGASTGGTAVVTTGAGALGTAARASSQRTGVAEIDIVVRRVTTLIPAGTTLTIATSGNSINRVVAAAYSVSNLVDGTLDATSGDDAAGVLGTTNAGQNASSTSLSPVTDATTTKANTFVFAAWAGNASSDWEVQSPGTELADIQTSAGSSERFLLVGVKQVSATGAQSVPATTASAGAVAGAVVACEVTVA